MRNCAMCNYCILEAKNCKWIVTGCTKGHECKNWEQNICNDYKKLRDDTEQAREMCLNCPFPECFNCFDNKAQWTGPAWTKEELDYLRKHIDQPRSEIAIALGKTRKAVQNMVSNLGLTTKKRLWTDEEDEFLKYHSIKETMDYTGRTEKAVSSRIKLISAKKRKEHEQNRNNSSTSKIATG